jgi:alpha-ribazole phosphatase/probable phosphoglycerate mutase
MPATWLYLARHGEVQGAGEYFYGHDDVPLSPRGAAQAMALAGRLTGTELSAVYASDLRRTVEFARAIAAPHALEVQPLKELREMSLGILEGISFREARERHPELASRPYSSMIDFRMPGGESLREVAERVRPAVAGLLERHRGQSFLVAGHNSTNRILLADALGVGLEGMFGFGQDFGCLNVIRYGERRARVMLLNERPEGPAGDRITLSGIAFEGSHGYLPAERLSPRVFRVDLVAHTPLERAGQTDRLGDTLDYRELAAATVRIGTTQSFHLLEALCRAIGTEILERFKAVSAVEVTAHKSAPEMAGKPDEVAVTLVVRRGEG